MDDALMLKALEWVVEVDVVEARASVEAARARRPNADPRELAETIFGGTAWKAAATGAVSGLPANPWVALPAAVADLTVMMKLEVNAVARVALVYDPTFFDDEDAKWELLVPVLGLNTASQFLRGFAVLGGMGVTRQAVRSVLSKGTLAAFKRVMLKYFGRRVTQKALITKTLPVVGSLIGGVWNWYEIRAVRHRVIAWFERQPALLTVSDEPSPQPVPD